MGEQVVGAVPYLLPLLSMGTGSVYELKLKEGCDAEAVIGKALREIKQKMFNHVKLDLSGQHVIVTAGSSLEKLFKLGGASSLGTSDFLVIMSGSITLEVAVHVAKCLYMRDVQISIHKQLNLRQRSHRDRVEETLQAAINATGDLHFHNVHFTCTEPCRSIGVVWLPAKSVIPRATADTPRSYFIAHNCTWQGFQNCLALGHPDIKAAGVCEVQLKECTLAQVLPDISHGMVPDEIDEDRYNLIAVWQGIEMSVQSCKLQGAPSRKSVPEGLPEGFVLRSIMVIAPHTNVTITDSKLTCEYSPLAPQWSTTGTSIKLEQHTSLEITGCDLSGVYITANSPATSLTVKDCTLRDAPSPKGASDPGPASRIDTMGHLSMTRVQINSRNPCRHPILKIGAPQHLQLFQGSGGSPSRKAELKEVTVVAMAGMAMEVGIGTTTCTSCVFSDRPDTPRQLWCNVVEAGDKGVLVMDDCTVTNQAECASNTWAALGIKEGARGIIRRSTLTSRSVALNTVESTALLSETQLEGSQMIHLSSDPQDIIGAVELHGKSNIVMDKCTLRAMTAWGVLHPGDSAELRNCTLVHRSYTSLLTRHISCPSWTWKFSKKAAVKMGQTAMMILLTRSTEADFDGVIKLPTSGPQVKESSQTKQQKKEGTGRGAGEASAAAGPSSTTAAPSSRPTAAGATASVGGAASASPAAAAAAGVSALSLSSAAAAGGEEAPLEAPPKPSFREIVEASVDAAWAGEPSHWCMTERRACATCEAKGDDGVELQLCSGCGFTRYCSAACQKADWRGHKAICKRLQANAASKKLLAVD